MSDIFRRFVKKRRMRNRIQKAVDLFQEGYNCSQSVFVAFSDLYNIEKKTALKLSTSFGGGFAGNREICGAVSAMAMVAGLETGTSVPKDKEGKIRNYEQVNTLLESFRKEHGSVLCKHLLGLEECEGVAKKECKEYVYSCAMLLEKFFHSE